jgi:hypothetical protein
MRMRPLTCFLPHLSFNVSALTVNPLFASICLSGLYFVLPGHLIWDPLLIVCKLVNPDESTSLRSHKPHVLSSTTQQPKPDLEAIVRRERAIREAGIGQSGAGQKVESQKLRKVPSVPTNGQRKFGIRASGGSLVDNDISLFFFGSAAASGRDDMRKEDLRSSVGSAVPLTTSLSQTEKPASIEEAAAKFTHLDLTKSASELTLVEGDES